MAVREPRLTKEEHARLGAEIYERHVRPQVEAGNHGKIVAVDVDTGEFEVDNETLVAAQRLLARLRFAAQSLTNLLEPLADLRFRTAVCGLIILALDPQIILRRYRSF